MPKRPARAKPAVPPPASPAASQPSTTPPPPPSSPPAGTIQVFPFDLHPGDHWTDEEGREWEIIKATTYRQGKTVRVRVRRVDLPTVEDLRFLASHERVTVRRPEAAS